MASSTTPDAAAQPPNAKARERVFAITELAEAIFLEVPARHLLVNVQRTSKHFKAIIEGSTPLQQALFFTPIPSCRPSFHDDNSYDGDGDIQWQGSSCSFWAIGADPKRKVRVAEHPIVSLGAWASEFSCINSSALSYSQASWRQQLVTQPAIQAVEVYNCEARDSQGVLVASDAGLRMSELNELAEKNNLGRIGDRRNNIGLRGWYRWRFSRWGELSARDFLQWLQEYDSEEESDTAEYIRSTK